MVVCICRAVIIKEDLPFCREFSIVLLFTKLSNFELLRTQLFDG